MALWQMRPCWGADAAAATPPRLAAGVGVPGGGVSAGGPGGCGGRAFLVRLHTLSTRSHCPSLPSLRPARPPSSLTAGGILSPLRLRLLSSVSRPPAKFGRDSIVGTKKCFCFLCSQARHPGREAPGGSRTLQAVDCATAEATSTGWAIGMGHRVSRMVLGV